MAPARCLVIAALAIITKSGDADLFAAVIDHETTPIQTTGSPEVHVSRSHSILHPTGPRSQSQKPPPAAAAVTRKIRSDLVSRYRRSVELQNALQAFDYDVANGGRLGNKYQVNDDVRNVTTSCVLVERISLQSKDGSQPWHNDRSVRRTVTTLLLHLVEVRMDFGAAPVDRQSTVSESMCLININVRLHFST